MKSGSTGASVSAEISEASEVERSTKSESGGRSIDKSGGKLVELEEGRPFELFKRKTRGGRGALVKKPEPPFKRSRHESNFLMEK
jgi:hypothetical protein